MTVSLRGTLIRRFLRSKLRLLWILWQHPANWPRAIPRGGKARCCRSCRVAVFATRRINIPRSQSTSFLDMARRVPHGDGPATCARVPTGDLCRGAHHRLHHEAQLPWGRTSTTVDGSGPGLRLTPLPGPSDCHQDQPGGAIVVGAVGVT